MNKVLIVIVTVLGSNAALANTWVHCKNDGKLINQNFDVVTIKNNTIYLQNYSTNYSDTKRVNTIATLPATANCTVTGVGSGE